jgi:hypothetical protein
MLHISQTGLVPLRVLSLQLYAQLGTNCIAASDTPLRKAREVFRSV